MLLTLPANHRLGWKWLTQTNTLAYYDTEFKMAVKSLMILVIIELIMLLNSVCDKSVKIKCLEISTMQVND
jgi:hypothetical protein